LHSPFPEGDGVFPGCVALGRIALPFSLLVRNKHSSLPLLRLWGRSGMFLWLAYLSASVADVVVFDRSDVQHVGYV
jgi:hypothetical protein